MLGKITRVEVGMGGYDNAMFGISFTFEGSGCGVGDFRGTWADPPSDFAKWTLDDQTRVWGEMCREIVGWLKDAKVSTVEQLKNVPVEVTFEGNRIKSWRILTEVR